MEISSLTVKLIILLVPGLISYFVYRRITVRETKRSDLMFIVVSILLGFISYMSIQSTFNLGCLIINFFREVPIVAYQLNSLQLITKDTPIDYVEVLGAVFAGIIIAGIFGKMDSSNTINKIAVEFGLTKKLNDQSIYRQYLINENLTWVYVRDINNRLTYLGAVALFSDKENDKEIVLNEVTVYSFPESVELYRLQSVYLNFGSENIIIEEAKILEHEQEQPALRS